jgi:hypothetical protein
MKDNQLMMRQIMEEAGAQLGHKLIGFGLPSFRIGEALELAESTLLNSFKRKIKNGRPTELLNIINGKQCVGAIAFIQNFIHDRSKSSLQKELYHTYYLELTHALQINSTTASKISSSVMPYVLDKIIETFTKNNVSQDQLLRILNDKSID